jgi:hypothetical protein
MVATRLATLHQAVRWEAKGSSGTIVCQTEALGNKCGGRSRIGITRDQNKMPYGSVCRFPKSSKQSILCRGILFLDYKSRRIRILKSCEVSSSILSYPCHADQLSLELSSRKKRAQHFTRPGSN